MTGKLETVRVYDFDTKRVTNIPAAELTPGMVLANVEGVEGEVYISPADVKPGSIQHGEFGPEVKRILAVLYDVIHEVYSVTPEEWEEGFRRDVNPGNEIDVWFRIAACYRHFTRGQELGAEGKKVLFRLILAWASNGPEHALQTFAAPHGTISRGRAKEIVEQIGAGIARPELDALLTEAGIQGG